MLTGRCLCGEVRFEVRGEAGFLGFCHCTMCQRASGSAFGANVPVGEDEVVWLSGRDRITEYESSPGQHRAFCTRCGSPLYKRLEGKSELRLRLGLLEQDPGVRPGGHFMVDAKAAWFEISDDLPRFTEAEVAKPSKRSG